MASLVIWRLGIAGFVYLFMELFRFAWATFPRIWRRLVVGDTRLSGLVAFCRLNLYLISFLACGGLGVHVFKLALIWNGSESVGQSFDEVLEGALQWTGASVATGVLFVWGMCRLDGIDRLHGEEGPAVLSGNQQ